MKTDPNFKLAKKLRIRLNAIIKKDLRAGSAVNDLGCSIEDLRTHLEGYFYDRKLTNEKMTWENYNYFGWHIDHILPLASFDLTDREQFLKANHYTNLQPMWMEDNFAKSDKIIIKEEIINGNT